MIHDILTIIIDKILDWILYGDHKYTVGDNRGSDITYICHITIIVYNNTPCGFCAILLLDV